MNALDTAPLPENLSRSLAEVLQALAGAVQALNVAASVISGQPVSVLQSSPHAPPPPPDPLSVSAAINEFLRAKARAGRSDRYLRALRVSLGSFARGRFNRPLEQITPEDLESWIEGRAWSPRTQAGYLSDVATFFNWCVRRDLCPRNPAALVDLPEVEEKPPSVHTPEQVRAILEFARRYDLNLCRCLALRYFAGLRSIEVQRSEEKHIGERFFEVTSGNAKRTRGRRRRLVTIQPNLRAWLALGGSIEFGDHGNRWRWFNAALKRQTGIAWLDNAARHSFVSYHVAHFADIKRTAAESGHTEEMLFSVYREIRCADGTLLTPDVARRFWEIVPV